MPVEDDVFIDEAIEAYKNNGIPRKAWLNRFRYDWENKMGIPTGLSLEELREYVDSDDEIKRLITEERYPGFAVDDLVEVGLTFKQINSYFKVFQRKF